MFNACCPDIRDLRSLLDYVAHSLRYDTALVLVPAAHSFRAVAAHSSSPTPKCSVRADSSTPKRLVRVGVALAHPETLGPR